MVIFNSYVSLPEGIKRDILESDLLNMAIEIVDLQGITNSRIDIIDGIFTAQDKMAFRANVIFF